MIKINIIKNKVIHPFLVAIFPIIFIYSHNIDEIPIKQLIIPILVSVVFSIILYLLLCLIFKNKIKVGIMVSIFFILFFVYGSLFDLIRETLVDVAKNRYLIPMTLLLYGYICYFIKCVRSQEKLKVINELTNIIMIILLIFNIINISYHALESISQNDRKNSQVSMNINKKLPDIYYIILDEYASPHTIKEIYGYDNSSFIHFLESNGFFVANNSNGKFDETHKCIASILNMKYIKDNESDIDIYKEITDNKVCKELRNYGYEYIHIGSWYELDRYQIKADKYFNYFKSIETKRRINDFDNVLLKTTMLRPLEYLFVADDYFNYYRDSLFYSLDKFEEVSLNKQKNKFVFMHLLFPHKPFVFDKDGKEISPSESDNWDNKDIYLGQYIYVTKRIKQTILNLLSNSKDKDIIVVVQSDHGPRGLRNEKIKNEKLRILNAIYINNEKNLKEDIEPIDTFKIIFDDLKTRGK